VTLLSSGLSSAFPKACELGGWVELGSAVLHPVPKTWRHLIPDRPITNARREAMYRAKEKGASTGGEAPMWRAVGEGQRTSHRRGGNRTV